MAARANLGPSSDHLAPVAGDLARFETKLRDDLATDGLAAPPMLDLVAAGGKRLRPGLLLLCAKLGEYEFERLAAAALAVELTHAATLVHDDVIDRSPTRRGRPTVVATAGEPAAIVVADYYFAKSYLMASRCPDPAVVAILARAVMDICEGELRQQAARYQYWIPVADYLERARLKTATLIAASCESGALLGRLPTPGRRTLAAYGMALGVAFQIADDVLDYVGTEEQLGKPVGHDLLEGHVTLPLLLTQADPTAAANLRGLLVDGRPLSSEQVAEVVEIVRQAEAPAAALAEARDRVEIAVAELTRLPECPARSSLDGLARYVVARNV